MGNIEEETYKFKDHLPICSSNAVGGGLVEIGIEKVLGHEALDVYRLSIGYVAWVSVKEGFGEYGYTEFDPDPDSDFDKI